MSLLKNRLLMLKNTHYLDAKMVATNLLNVELLEHGKLLRQQIEKQCSRIQSSSGAEVNATQCVTESDALLEEFKKMNPRLRFVYTNEFRKNMQLLKQNTKRKTNEGIIKTVSYSSENYGAEDMLVKFIYKNGEKSKLLKTDYIFHTASGLAKLYNIQRERKIWWMRFSADPSRYYLKPYNLSSTEDISNTDIPNAQSITIKTRLPIGDIDVEHITLIPLHEASLQNEKEFEIYDERSKKNQLPSVIRSVINLDMATCALIFDGAANIKRENTLFLNRKLTPYQCLVTCLDKASSCEDLSDLVTHICNVLQQAGLRLLNENYNFGDCLVVDNQLDIADMLGIPYTILVNPNSLTSGLLELRSRDTTLNETIHISDIPEYLLSIFRAN